MAVDAYSPCPCGSGKKFRWCCQPIHVQLDRAFRQEADGQHEAALRIMEEIVAQHADNPEAWGRRAQLLYQNDRVEEAENSLQKALDLNPNYPFGHYLRGRFREFEGEIPGALMLFRKAVDLYDPGARAVRAELYATICNSELKLNRPVAAKVALQMAVHCDPVHPELRKGLDEVFGPDSKFPQAARKDYSFLSPSDQAAGERREAWNRVFQAGPALRLGDAVRVFSQLTQEDAEDAAAWYNLGLAYAWLGDHPPALEALDRYVALEADESRAAAAWTLAEVLRCGQGMEEYADVIEHSVLWEIREPQAVVAVLQEWEGQRRLLGVQSNPQERVLMGLVVEPPALVTASGGGVQIAPLAGHLTIFESLLRVWHTNEKTFDRVRHDLWQRCGAALSEVNRTRRPASFPDAFSEAMAFPVQGTDADEIKKKVSEHARQFFEETWLHRPLRSLNQIPPIDAAGHSTLRKKLRGVVQFLQDCAAVSSWQLYDFEQLRRKLGLAEAKAVASSTAIDPTVMGAAELGALKVDELADDQLETAFQSALKLDARDLAGNFAQSLVARPARPDKPDRFPLYSHLSQQANATGDLSAAVDWINAGEKADCENNEGRRRNDYELRRGQLQVKRGELDDAEAVFQRLIDRVPGEMRFRGAAAEAMLSAKQSARALKFAEGGLSKAREKNDRDSEQYFMELVAAAKR